MPEQTVEDEDDPARRRGWGWGDDRGGGMEGRQKQRQESVKQQGM